METRSTDSELSTVANSDLVKARHLLALLLSLGRPARPPELASLCTLFPAPPELVHYLCSIPNSPISLTPDLCVTPSPVAAITFSESAAISNFVNVLLQPPPPKHLLTGACGLNRLWEETDAVGTSYKKRKRLVLECELVPPAKARLILKSGVVKDENRAPIEIQYTFPKVTFHGTEYVSRSISMSGDMSNMLNDFLFAAPFNGKFSPGQLSCQLKDKDIRPSESETDTSFTVQREGNKELMACDTNAKPGLPSSTLDNLAVYRRARKGTNVRTRTTYMATFCLERIEASNMSRTEAANVDENFTATNMRITEKESTMEAEEKEWSVASGSIIRETGDQNLFLPVNTDPLDIPCESGGMEKVNCKDKISSFNTELMNRQLGIWSLPPAVEVPVAQKQVSKHDKAINAISPRLQQLCKSLEHDKAINTPKEKRQSKGDRKVPDRRQKLRQNNDSDLHVKERKISSTSISAKDQMEQKILPNFESYIVEEEEGSGGYGTVYRARRKNDGATVAIKCPHDKAHKHHVNNELRMLERFGGKHFIIKYEGCFKNEDSDCFVLEHVEHDRPEVLKKEIDVFQLQWYGYCMFRALASLHKQGIIHRDVKPGNFLFSRKTNKGYLIDFNLAMDLHQKYGNSGKSKVGCDLRTNHVKLPNADSVQSKDRKLSSARSSETANLKTKKDYKSKLDMKNLRRKALAQTKTCNNDLGSWNVSKSQGADGGSGVTSAGKIREPVPCQGRKELISLVQEARQTQNHEASSVLSPTKKRVVAPQNVDSMLAYLTPMPLVSTGIFVGGSQFMNRGNGKSKKEGPCVGTKGFRAPEVLFRSLYQGPKVDIWSAGVSFLYLMIGRTPFFGDPEQNIKDIAKLRGSEDLWEVAKLHNRESSFPEDLYKYESLPSMKLWDWCEMNTKRPDFLKSMPISLFDLVDKCLTVNPRLRITAEEALRHEFFAPCHEVLRKQRLQRQVVLTQPQYKENMSSLSGKSILKPRKISRVNA